MRSMFILGCRIWLSGMVFVLVAGQGPVWSPNACNADHFVIGTDQNFWHPFTYAENGKAKGIHVDVVSKALENLGHTASFTPLPWKRCLFLAGKGDIDAVVSASYKKDRDAYLIYPQDAAGAFMSRWRITQVAYAIVVPFGSQYHFDGNVGGLPGPVRVPLGYSVADDLRKLGVNVHTAVDTRLCIQQLANSQRGVVITPLLNARYFRKKKSLQGKIKILKDPLVSKSYFMAFSRNSKKVNAAIAARIWNEIERLRNDTAYMEQVFNAHLQAGGPKS